MIARVPASSANLGPGFDVLGMALSLYAEIGVAEDEIPAGAHPADDRHIATTAFRRVGGTGALWERSPIPMGRGLGYSAAARIGGLMLGLAQQGLSDAPDRVLAEAIALEGHADNAAAAVLGGVVVTTGARSIRVPMQLDPAVVVWIPSFTTRTDQSRTKLPAEVSRADAVFNIGHASMLVAALAAGDVDALRHAVDDRLHETARFAGSPTSRAAYEAALEAGAWAAWLSGSGPTVAAMCAVDQADQLAATLAESAGGVGHTKVLRIDHAGATLEG
jgi:homoserine kinase